MQGQGQAQRWARGAARADVVGTSHVLGPGKRGFLRLSFILCNPHQELATDIVLSPFTCEESEAPGDGEICSHRPCLAEAGLKPGTLKQCSSLQPTTCDILYSRLGGVVTVLGFPSSLTLTGWHYASHLTSQDLSPQPSAQITTPPLCSLQGCGDGPTK